MIVHYCMVNGVCGVTYRDLSISLFYARPHANAKLTFSLHVVWDVSWQQRHPFRLGGASTAPLAVVKPGM